MKRKTFIDTCTDSRSYKIAVKLENITSGCWICDRRSGRTFKQLKRRGAGCASFLPRRIRNWKEYRKHQYKDT